MNEIPSEQHELNLQKLTEKPPDILVTSPVSTSQGAISEPEQSSVPQFGALIGLDYGIKRWGIAICNSEQTLAVPVETWNVRSPEQNLKHLKEVISDYRIVGFVVGLPIRIDGAEGDQALIVRRFGLWLAEQTKLPVTFWDERYSSTEAELLLWNQGISPTKAKDRLDRLAAQIILQSYLDGRQKDRTQKDRT